MNKLSTAATNELWMKANDACIAWLAADTGTRPERRYARPNDNPTHEEKLALITNNIAFLEFDEKRRELYMAARTAVSEAEAAGAAPRIPGLDENLRALAERACSFHERQALEQLRRDEIELRAYLERLHNAESEGERWSIRRRFTKTGDPVKIDDDLRRLANAHRARTGT